MDEQEARITRLEQDVQIIREQCATKADLSELKAEVMAKLAVVKADILVRLAEVESGLRTEMAGLKTDMVQSIGNLRVEMEQANGRLLRWVVLVVFLGQLAPVLLKHFGA